MIRGRQLRFWTRLVAGIAGAGCALSSPASDFVWPTPNTAWVENKPFEAFVQPTNTGLTESGMFGCVRNSGWKFHEGLDLLPLERDRRGEAADPVFAMATGMVQHAALQSGLSSYGRYVVVEHRQMRPAIITLYAHLLSVAPEVRPGAAVTAGQTIGIMGRSAANYTIPRDRAHVHVEAGVWLSRNFQRWYDAKRFTTRNHHGVFNGMNIVGFDLLDFLERQRAAQVRSLQEYLDRLPTAVTITIRNGARPDFVERYPELVTGSLADGELGGWRIEFSWYGFPKSWTPLGTAEFGGADPGARAVVFHDPDLIERFQCQDVVRLNRGYALPGPKATEVLDILFAGL